MFEILLNKLWGNYHIDTTSPTFTKDIINAQFNHWYEPVLFHLPLRFQQKIREYIPSSWLMGYYQAKRAERIFHEPKIILDEDTSAVLRKELSTDY